MNQQPQLLSLRRMRRRQGERGQALIEFALIMPILFLMLIGVAFMAQGFNLQMVLYGAAYEGARAWAKDPAGGDYIHCNPPACKPAEGNARNFEKYVIPVVRQYVTQNGFDGQAVLFFSETRNGFETAMDLVGNDTQLVRVSLLYPIKLPVGNLASNFERILISASCTMRRGG